MRRISPPIRFRSRGIALSDLILCVAVLSVLIGIAVNVVPGLRAAADRTRLDKDAKTLNLAVAAYLNSGGKIPAGTTPEAILAKLKTVPAAGTARTIAGLKGSMIDVRLRGKRISTGDTGRRITWDSQTLSFRVTQSGEGWSEMQIDDSLAALNHGTEARRTSLKFATTEPWVWDYADSLAPAHGPSNIPVNDPTVSQPSLDDPTFLLLPPVITPDAGEYQYQMFPLAGGIQNPNPPGTSNIRYQVDGGGWATWNGTPLSLSRELTHTVQAFTEGLDGETYQQSTTVTANYVTYFIRGQANATFTNPSGDSRLEQSVSGSGREFRWGRVQSAGQTQSSLEFVPGSPFEAGPNESFTVATVRYTNGVSRAGTNATSVTASISLPLSVPSSTTITVNLPLRMQNTIHYEWTPASDYHDFVWVPDTVPVAAPIVVLDRIYRLTLFSSAPGSTQDGTDLKIPVGENQSVDVTLTARLEPM